MTALRPSLDNVFGALLRISAPIIRSYYKPSACIAGTRIAIEVLRCSGYEAAAVPMFARAGNRAFMKAVDRSVPEERWEERGVQVVEINTESKIGYPAHLVAVCQGHLIDLTAGQFNRPDKKIHVPDALIIELPFDWATTRMPIGRGLAAGGVMLYQKLHTKPSIDYRCTKDWLQNPIGPIVDATMAVL